MSIEGDLASLITTNLRLAPARAVPEIMLWQAGPASGVGQLAAASGGRSPYWAYQWAGGTALARYLLDRPEAVAGRHVLDLGCGGGIVAIAAAKAGAREVDAVDIDPAAVVATTLAAAANAVRVAATVTDMLGGPPPRVEAMLVGDLFYAPRLAARATTFLARCRAVGIEVLVGDPGRAHLPTTRLERRAEITVPDFGDRDSVAMPSAVYAFAGEVNARPGGSNRPGGR